MKNRHLFYKNKYSNAQFVALKRKGLLCLAMAGAVLANPFILGGCSNGQDGKDGAPGTVWRAGENYAEFSDAKVGDFFIDTNDYILYQKNADSWVVVIENYGKPGDTPLAPIAPVIEIDEDGFWVIDGVTQEVKAKGDKGEPGTTPKVEIKDGFWYINGVKSVKAEAVDGHTPLITINNEGFWVVDDKPTEVKATPSKIEIKNGLWYIDGVQSGQAKGKDGNSWNVGVEYPSNPNVGDMFLNNTTWDVYQYNGSIWEFKGNIKGGSGQTGQQGAVGKDGKGIKNIESEYFYDKTTQKEYYVFTFYYTDGTSEEKRVEIPQKITSISYIGEESYYKVEAGKEPTLKINVLYDNLTSEEIEITDEMYVVEGEYVKPNFQEVGNYKVKISYRGVETTFTINVLEPLKQFTIKANEYKDLKKFSHWEDSLGNEVSSDLTYSYEASEEKELTAVYEEFLEMTGPRFNSEGDLWQEETNQYVSTNRNGWLNMAYITEAMKSGMFVEFEIKSTETLNAFCFGISEKSYLETYNANPAKNGWFINDTTQNFNYLFVSEYNFYSGVSSNTREPFAYLQKCQGMSDIKNGKFKFESASVDINAIIADKVSSNASVNIKIVLTDKVLVYIENQLFSATNLPEYAINEGKEYFFTFNGSIIEMTVLDFGYTQDLELLGSYDEMVSSPLQKESFSGKTLTLLGDSITLGVGASSNDNRFSTVLSSSMGMVENNMGESGTVFCTGGHRTSRLGDISNISYDSDYVGVLLGVNDFDQCKSEGNTTYYSLGEFGSKDTTTIYGAVDAMCCSLVERFRYTDTKMFLMTPVVTSWNNSVSSDKNWDQSKVNECGYTLRQLCDAIEQVAKYYGIVTLDLNEECILTEDDFSDGIHPNDIGHAKIATTIEQWLLQNFSY